MKLSLSQSPPQANVKHLIRQFDPHCPSHPPGQLPPAKWMDVPFDIMREVVQRLAVHDVQTTLLVCREWHDGFANGVVSLKPRLLKLQELAYRWACLRVSLLTSLLLLGPGRKVTVSMAVECTIAAGKEYESRIPACSFLSRYLSMGWGCGGTYGRHAYNMWLILIGCLCLLRRFPALQQLDMSACRRVSNDELAHLHYLPNLTRWVSFVPLSCCLCIKSPLCMSSFCVPILTECSPSAALQHSSSHR